MKVPLLLLLLLCLSACQSSSSSNPQAPPFGEIQTIFQASCVDCHEDPDGSAGLVLEGQRTYRMLVEAQSSQVPTMPRVTPGDLDQSYLVHKLRGTHESVGGEGEAMPAASWATISEEQVRQIEAWITAGAKKN